MEDACRASPRPQSNDEEDAKTFCCPICLETVKDEAFLDRCFHSFCHPCIVRWTKTVAGKQSQSLHAIRCPLCKIENFSILHDLKGLGIRQQYVNQDSDNSFFTSAHIFRCQCYHGRTGSLNCKHKISLYWKSRRHLKRNLWLETWLRREMQALTQEKDVDVIVHHVLGVIEFFLERQGRVHSSSSPEEKRGEFRAIVSDAAKPFLLGHTEHFVDELELFLVLGLNIEAYDKMYMHCSAGRSQGSNGSCSNEGETEAATLELFSEDLG